MARASIVAFALLLLAACGSSESGGSTVDQPGDVSIPTDVENQLEDDVVQSLAEVAGTFWRPATDGGAAVDPDDGDFWEFVSDGDGIGIIGHDGCNRFATSRGLEDPPPRLENGVLVDLEVASTLMDCPGDANGPYPQQGDLLRLVDRGDRLLVETDGAVRVELTQVDSRSADGATTDPASFTTLDAFADIVRAYWVPIEQHGEPVESSLGAFWRLGGGSGDISLSGFDGCDHFRSDQFPEAATTMTDGVFLGGVTTTSAKGCGDVPTLSPQEGDTFEISNDGATIRVSNDGSVRFVLELRSEEPLGGRLRPEEEREMEAEMEADQQAEEERLAEETQASLDQLRVDLDAARLRWDASGIENYIVDFAAGCLACDSWPVDPTAVDNRYTVVVESGVGSGPWADSTIGASVDDWFDHLQTHMDAGGFATAEFDADLGFPTSLYIAQAGPAGTDTAVGVDEAQLSDVVIEFARES